MKLSSRERTMIVLFSILLIGVAIYFFVVEPIHADHDIAKVEFDTVDTQYRIIKTKVKGDNEINEIIGDYRDRIAILDAKLPHQIYLEKIINDMFTHFESYDVIVDTVTFNLVDAKSETQVAEITDGSLAIENLRPVMSIDDILDSYEAEENLTGILEVDGEEVVLDYTNIGYMNVNMSFTSNYNIFKDALRAFEIVDSTVIPSNVTISKAALDDTEKEPDNNEVYIGLTVAIPFYYDNEPLEDIFFDYDFEAPVDFNEHGPFEYGDLEDNYVGESSSSSEAIASVKADFNINLRNVTSDLAAQTMTYASIASSTLDLDSNNDERYVLDILESNGNLSFKFKNDLSSYPSGSNYESFFVDNNIIIKVNSTGRFNNEDGGGMTLILNNKSTKKVLIYVTNDDLNNPRFKVIVNSGQFDVIRN